MTRSLQITWILVRDGRNYGKMLKRYYVKNTEHFLKLLWITWNLHKILLNLKKKAQLDRLNILEVIDPANVITSLPVSSCFRTPFESKHVHGSQALLEPALKHFHANFPLI